MRYPPAPAPSSGTPDARALASQRIGGAARGGSRFRRPCRDGFGLIGPFRRPLHAGGDASNRIVVSCAAARCDLRPALACQIAPLVAVVAVQRRAGEILDPHPRRSLVPEAEHLRRAARHIHDAVRPVRTAIVDANDDRSAVLEIGHARIDRHGQGRRRRRQPFHVVDLAIGGAAAMKQLAIPGRRADPVVGRVLARLIPDAIDLVGDTGGVPAAALRHRLAERDDALAELLAISAGAAPDQACADRANRQKQDEETERREGGHAPNEPRRRERARTFTHPTQGNDPVTQAPPIAAQALDRLSGERVRKG